MANDEQRKGTRCAVCVMCGRCFEEDAAADGPGGAGGSGTSGAKWTGTRCDVCVSCGKCAEAWGLLGKDKSDADSGPTNWGDAFRMMDTGSAGAPPPVSGAPGVNAPEMPGAGSAQAEAADGTSDDGSGEETPHDGAAKPSSFACLKRGADGEEPDTSTGATPGVSSACKEHGFDDMNKLIADLGIKPPGVA